MANHDFFFAGLFLDFGFALGFDDACFAGGCSGAFLFAAAFETFAQARSEAPLIYEAFGVSPSCAPESNSRSLTPVRQSRRPGSG